VENLTPLKKLQKISSEIMTPIKRIRIKLWVGPAIKHKVTIVMRARAEIILKVVF
tara:strand:+ start:535 stop:699 length:165 start_codon:yes stop_codon:yes gene_type:complete